MPPKLELLQAGWKHDGAPHIGAEQPHVGPLHADMFIGAATYIGAEHIEPPQFIIGEKQPGE